MPRSHYYLVFHLNSVVWDCVLVCPTHDAHKAIDIYCMRFNFRSVNFCGLQILAIFALLFSSVRLGGLGITNPTTQTAHQHSRYITESHSTSSSTDPATGAYLPNRNQGHAKESQVRSTYYPPRTRSTECIWANRQALHQLWHKLTKPCMNTMQWLLLVIGFILYLVGLAKISV